MDFLKSAVASAIAKSSSFPYTIGDRIDNNESIWTLHNAIKKVWNLHTGLHSSHKSVG
jgi:SCY1-like protein 1